MQTVPIPEGSQRLAGGKGAERRHHRLEVEARASADTTGIRIPRGNGSLGVAIVVVVSVWGLSHPSGMPN